MKKMFRIVSAVVCVAMLLCGLSLQSFAARTNTKEVVRLYGDIDGNGVVEQSDFDYILGILSGEIEMPAVGSPEYYAADIMGDGITMEDARRCYRYMKGIDTAETYSPAQRELDLFNDLVNIIKNEDFFEDRVIYYSYEYEYMETRNLDFGIYTGMIKDAMASEDGETEKYYRLNRVGNVETALPGKDNNTVSDLTLDNIQDMSIEIGVPCTFSSDINAPASFTSGTSQYDLTWLTEKESRYTDCIKVTIEIKSESYNSIPSNIRDLAKKQLAEGYELAEGEQSYLDLYQTALYNMYGTDIIELGSSYPLVQKEEADGISTEISAKLGDIKTSGSLIYYFDRATLNPIAASYTVETDIDQKVSMALELGSAISIKGSMDPRNLMITQNNYWFYNYFNS